jgi:hypothetical protein
MVVTSDALPRVLRAIMAALVVALAVGGIPGASLRVVEHDLVAPPVPATVKERDGALVVTVRDGAGGPPLAGAHVRALALLDLRAYLADARDTDRAGVAHMMNLPHGEAWLLAEAPGHARGSSRLVVEGGLRSVVIDLAPEHTIDVVVKDELGHPLPAAEIQIVASTDPLPVGARASPEGTAHVGRLTTGPWRVTARAPGFEPATAHASADGELVTLVVRKLGSLAVRVVDGDGNAVADARVDADG